MILGIGYKAGSGKDTAAKYISEQYGFLRIHFATGLKRAAKEIFGFSKAQLFGNAKELPDEYWDKLSPRQALQELGQMCREEFGEDVWIKSVQKFLLQEYGSLSATDIIFADVRHINEAEWIHANGGKLIHIHRNNIGTFRPDHISECALDTYTGWDYTIDNNRSIGVLFDRVDDIMRGLGRRPLCSQ